MNTIKQNFRQSTALLFIAFTFVFSIKAKAESDICLSDNQIETGCVTSGVPTIVESGVQKITKDNANASIEPSTRIFKKGNKQLIVYSDVPGATPSEFYKIRVRSGASEGKWQPAFALITRSLYSQAKIPKKEGSTVNMEAYYEHVKDWSHTYVNIEMNSQVEIEVSKIDGKPIKKAAIHPIAKASNATIRDGKVYFMIDKAALVTVDIDGQMDDQDTGEGYAGPAIHTLSIYANPIMDKPKINTKGVVLVKAGENPPTDPTTYETLYFSAGVHDLGRNFQVYENKSYFIPGDAIVYATFNNLSSGEGKNIKIYGLGTISGDRIKHPDYDPAYKELKNAKGSENKKQVTLGKTWKLICIENADNVLIEGITAANPCFHSINLVADGNRPNMNEKVTAVKWAKVISWRENGDGIGSAHLVEDCFIRTQDDCSYIKGDRRRCVFWTDVNGAIFHMAGIPKTFPIVIEDCDVIYARNRSKSWRGGRVFSQRAEGNAEQYNVNLLIRNFRIEDKRPTLQTFQLYSSEAFKGKGDATIGNPLRGITGSTIGSSYSGITFQNITVAAQSVCGLPEVLYGCKESPWSGITFDNVVIAGKKLTGLNDFEHVNEHVTNITFK